MVVIKLDLSVHFSHLIASFIVRDSIDQLVASVVEGEVFAVDDAYFVAIFVEFLVVAVLIDVDPVPVLIVSEWVVLVVVLDQVAEVVVLFGLPLALARLFHHPLLSLRLLKPEILFLLHLLLPLQPILSLVVPRVVDLGFEFGLGVRLALASGVLEGGLELVASRGQTHFCLIFLRVHDVTG
jgi:hypothetical protein